MSSHNELESIRRRLDSLQDEARSLRERLDAIESHGASPAPVHPVESTPQPAPPPVPPPLPAEPVAAKPAPEPLPPVKPAPRPAPAPEPEWLRRTKAFAWEHIVGGRKLEEDGWESYIGTFLAPRVGILLLTLGVVFMLAFAVEKYGQLFGPGMRVASGYGVCAVLLILGWRLEKKYAPFARVLYSGGIALSYFVTFAAHFVSYAKVIDSAPVAIGLLGAVVVGWTAVAQWRKSRVVAVMVTVLGHITVALATSAQENLAPHAVVGLLLLALGSAFFLLWNRWYYVGAVGMVAVYANHAFWLSHASGGDTALEFWVSMAFLIAYFLVFSLAEMFSREDVRRERIPVWVRNAFVTANTLAFFALASMVVNHFTYSRDHQDVFRLVFGFGLVCMGLAYLHARGRDPLYNVYLTKGVAAVTLGLATRYANDGEMLTAALAIEMVVLLVSARRSGLVVTRVLALLVAVAAFIHGLLWTGVTDRFIHYTTEGYTAQAVQVALTLAAFVAAAVLYERTRWPRIAAGPWTKDLSPFFKGLDLFDDGTDRARDNYVPYGYAIGAGLLAWAHMTNLFPEGHRAAAMAVWTALLVAGATAFKSRPLGVPIWMGFFVSVWYGTAEFVQRGAAPLWALVAVPVLLSLCALSSEGKLLAFNPGLEILRRFAAAPYILYLGLAWLGGLALMQRLDAPWDTVALTVGGFMVAAHIVILHRGALALSSVLLYAMAGVAWIAGLGGVADFEMRGVLLGLLAALLATDRFFAYRQIDPPLKKFRADFSSVIVVVAMFGVFGLLSCIYILRDLPRGWQPAGYAFAAYWFLAYLFTWGRAWRGAMALIASLGTAALSTLLVLVYAYAASGGSGMTKYQGPLTVAFIMLAAFAFLWERVAALHPKVRERLGNADLVRALTVAAGTVYLLALLHRTPQLANYYLSISWTALGVVLFGVSFGLKAPFYRYAGLAVFGLTIVRVFLIDMSELQALYRVGAFMVLAVVLLGVSFGYFIARDKTKTASHADGES